MTILLFASNIMGQESSYHKISPDLWDKINQSSKTNEMLDVIIIMNEQFDAKRSEWQMKSLSKSERRAFVIDELQQLANNGQKPILTELQQNAKAALVDHIQSFWIINGISCSMTKDMVLAIAERPDVGLITMDEEVRLIDDPITETRATEQDGNQWNVLKVRADQVWDLGYTGAGVIVAIIDSGVNYNHTDIANNMWDGGSEYPHHGWDYVNNDDDPMDDNGHGTHCAGTVSSYNSNGKQCGIAKNAKIMALKTLKQDGNGNKSNRWKAVQFAIIHNADILNLSLGNSGKGGLWDERIVMENILNCGVVASVAAGNVGSTQNQTNYPIPKNIDAPGNCPSPWRHPDQTLAGGHSAAVTVGATTTNDTRASYSSIGPCTWTGGGSVLPYHDYPWAENDPDSIGLIKPDISAPGSGIYSLSHSDNTGYVSMSGTSMATPCVAGVMALMLEANPTLTPVEIDSIIETTAVKKSGQTSKNNTVGSGRIDALNAINYIINVCSAPTNLNASTSQANVILSWSPANNVVSYQVYRNGILITPSVSDSTYTDEGAPAGFNTYYVKSNGENSQSSVPSNQVSVYITTNINISAPNNLIADTTGVYDNHITLHWTEPNKRQETLYYTNSEPYYLVMPSEFSAAQHYPPSKLQQYAGMQIEHLFFNVRDEGTICSIMLYEGDAMNPGALIFEGSDTTTADHQLVDFLINQPVVLNPNKDLWVIVHTNGVLSIDYAYESPLGGDAFFFQYQGETTWLSLPIYSWNFQLGLSDNDYTYNLYQDGAAISSDITTPSCTASIDQGINQFEITAVTNNYESLPSNTLLLVKDAYSTSSLILNPNDNLIVLPNSSFTVSGTLINTDPANLILEDGAQLILNNETQATVRKNIIGYGTNSKVGTGWYFIASPIIDSFSPTPTMLSNTFDLYRLNNTIWENYQAHTQGFTINNGTGYLYANSNDITLEFAGTIIPFSTENTNTVSLVDGWNLVGNPYTFNVYSDKPYYIITTITEDTVSKNVITPVTNSGDAISPCAGIVVYSNGTDDLTFTTSANQWDANSKGIINIILSEQTFNRNGTSSETIDKAIVSFNDNNELPKFFFGISDAKVYIPLDNKDYAIVSAGNQNDIPVNFKAEKDGTYTLSVEIENIDLDYLHLIDHLTGADVDLLITPSYTFEASTSDYAVRFQLLFSETANSDDLSDEFIEGKTQILDITGRIVATEPNTKLAPGTYILRTVNGSNIKTEKIIIK